MAVPCFERYDMKPTLTLKIVTARNDGLTVEIRDGQHGTVVITLMNAEGRIIESEAIADTEVYKWINTRQDW
jgi:hypothetical protein